ncbi:MAG: response regulator, partial [Armatimonadetes bacterium]|nr:response regulator [Armatimonadota bacterium]
MMPSGAEGFQFVWKLRNDADKEVSGLPILVVSAVHSKTDLKLYPDQEDSTYEAGEYLPVQAFLDKPVQPGDLLESVARHVK